MQLKRVVPNLAAVDPQRSAAFYADVLGVETVMDHGWIATVADSSHPGAQFSLISEDAGAEALAEVSIEVDDVDGAYASALRAGAEIVHPLTDEDWGVRRFFLRDPDGHVINILSHA